MLRVMRIGPLITSSISARPASDSRERTSIVRAFERPLSGRFYTLPPRWLQPHRRDSSKLKGWDISPDRFLGQDLADVCIDYRDRAGSFGRA